MINWTEIGLTVFEAVLPVLAAALTGWLLGLAAKAWREFQLAQPDVAKQIASAAVWVIPVVEQLKHNGAIPDNAAAKAYAVQAILDVLSIKNIKVDASRVEKIVGDSVEGALREYKNWNSEPAGSLEL